MKSTPPLVPPLLQRSRGLGGPAEALIRRSAVAEIGRVRKFGFLHRRVRSSRESGVRVTI